MGLFASVITSELAPQSVQAQKKPKFAKRFAMVAFLPKVEHNQSAVAGMSVDQCSAVEDTLAGLSHGIIEEKMGHVMAEQINDHERRISTIEGEMKSLATKADLAEFKAEIMEYVQAGMRAQTEEFRVTFDQFSEAMERQNEALVRQSDKFSEAMERQSDRFSEALNKQSDEIRELREQGSRFKGAVDTLKYALPFLISIIAVLVAVLK